MATAAPPRPAPDAPAPKRVLRRLPDLSTVPRRVWLAGGLTGLVLVSLYLRTRQLSIPYWMDEGLSVGISAHKFWSIPGLMHQDGAPPLYYMLLHVWMGGFGASESATHAMSLLASLICIPVALWAGWSLWGERAGWYAAVLFAVNPFLDVYAQETRMYSLLVLEGIVVAAAFLHAYAYRRSKYTVLFGVAMAFMLYTHNWGLFVGAGAAVALIPCFLANDRNHPGERRRFLRDVAIGFGIPALLYLPWLPTAIFQSAHTAAPWTNPPQLGVPIVFSHELLGGGFSTGALLLGTGLGLWLIVRSRRDDRLALSAAATLLVATIAINWVLSQISPAFNPRYLAAVLGVTLLIGALGLARAARFGLVAVIVVGLLWADPASHTIDNKSNAKEIAYELGPMLRPGDLVIVGSPEQVPLFRYYLPTGVRFATELGATPDSGIMDWRDARQRLQAAQVRPDLENVLATVPAGQRVVFVRPVTSFGGNWDAPWTQLVRRRSAQWGDALSGDPRLVPQAAAPTYYRPEAANIAMHAVLYRKQS